MNQREISELDKGTTAINLGTIVGAGWVGFWQGSGIFWEPDILNYTPWVFPATNVAYQWYHRIRRLKDRGDQSSPETYREQVHAGRTGRYAPVVSVTLTSWITVGSHGIGHAIGYSIKHYSLN